MRLVFTIVVLAAVLGPWPAVAAYELPVDAPVSDPYRAPVTAYGPGNRGVDFATTPGTPVSVSAPGTVTFADQVGGNLFVVVDHGDGIRTTYGFLASIAVQVGQVLLQSQTVGTAGEDLHFGARLGEAYLDPWSLLGGPPHLVALDAASLPARDAGPPQSDSVGDDGAATSGGRNDDLANELAQQLTAEISNRFWAWLAAQRTPAPSTASAAGVPTAPMTAAGGFQAETDLISTPASAHESRSAAAALGLVVLGLLVLGLRVGSVIMARRRHGRKRRVRQMN